MQVVAISPSPSADQALIHQQHELRARIFHGRLAWQVEVSGGLERDRFDDLHPTYILARQENGQLVGCARLLPATGPTMVGEVFPYLLPTGRLVAHSKMVESSRFCVDTSLSSMKRDGPLHEATLTMLAGILEWCLTNHYSEIVTVTDLKFERILARVGWPLTRIGSPQPVGDTIAIAGQLPVDAGTFLQLRPQNYRSFIPSVGKAA